MEERNTVKTSRIDLIAQNGNTGEHYKYEEVADKLFDEFHGWVEYIPEWMHETLKGNITKILVEAFPDDAS